MVIRNNRDSCLLRTHVVAKGLLLLLSFGLIYGSPVRVVDLAEYEDEVEFLGDEHSDGVGTPLIGCDVNGDGWQDLVFAASRADGVDNLRFSVGEVFVVYGHPGSWIGPVQLEDQADVRIIGRDPGDNTGELLECGDLNGDGYGDVAIGAPSADGPNGNISLLGELHLVFGGPSLPQVIDLLTDPGPIVYGECDQAGFATNTRAATGDLNGDGIDDLALGALCDGFGGVGLRAGRAYVLFGRTSWPASLHLPNDADVVIYGAAAGDSAGQRFAIGQVEGSQIEDLVVSATGVDSSTSSALNVGYNYIFLGSPTWPSDVDLAIESADSVIEGVDHNDSAGGRGLGIMDIDADGVPEIILGTDRAEGVLNQNPFAGEARVYEVESPLPNHVHLSSATDLVIFGDLEDDELSDYFASGDVTGDGIDDLIVTASSGDGPDDTRLSAGDVHVIQGKKSFPAEIEVKKEEEDWVVYGAVSGDNLSAFDLSDINGDGVKEIASAARYSFNSPQAGILISPVDTDEDGVTNLPDNCARAFNPGQTDRDGDQVGDACDNCVDTPNVYQYDNDLDGIGDACDECLGALGGISGDADQDGIDGCIDNCPSTANADQLDTDGDQVGDACDPCPTDSINDEDHDGVCDAIDICIGIYNPLQLDSDTDGVGDACDVCPNSVDPSQLDSDEDGAGDACDCAPFNAGDRQAGEIRQLYVDRLPDDSSRLVWTSAAGAERYSVTRSQIANVASNAYGDCIADGLDEHEYQDVDVPAPGTGYAYLVQAENLDCGRGPLGFDSSGSERMNSSVSACAGPTFTDHYPISESAEFGSVTGSLTDLLASDDGYLTITEELTSGNPSIRFSSLEHRWSFSVSSGVRVELHVEGFTTANPGVDFDYLAFEYSTDGGQTFNPIALSDLPSSDNDFDLRGTLPASTVGSLLIRVVDTDSTEGAQDIDFVSLDEMFIRTLQ